MTSKEFAAKHEITVQAVNYAIHQGLIDADRVGRNWVIQNTIKTKGYRPNLRKDKRKAK